MNRIKLYPGIERDPPDAPQGIFVVVVSDVDRVPAKLTSANQIYQTQTKILNEKCETKNVSAKKLKR